MLVDFVKARTRLIVIVVLAMLSMTTAVFPQGRGRGGD